MSEKIALHRVSFKRFINFLYNDNGIMKSQLLGISTLLSVRSPAILTKKEIIECLWGDEEDGGPDWAESNITSAIYTLRKAGMNIKCIRDFGYYHDKKNERKFAKLRARSPLVISIPKLNLE